MERRTEREYERPRMTVVELLHRAMILAGSETDTSGINPMADPEDI